MLKHINISETTNKEMLAAMAIGNPVLAKWHLTVRKKLCRKVGNPDLTYSMHKFRTALFKLDPANPIAIEGVNIPKVDVAKIFAVKEFEGIVVQGYYKLVYRVMHKVERDSYLSEEDCASYGMIGLLQALYQFNVTKKVKFITYATWVIRRHIQRALNRAKRNYPWSQRMLDLWQKFEQTKRDLNRPCNFEEVVSIMNLNKKERAALEAACRKMIGQSNVKEEDNGQRFGIENLPAPTKTHQLDADQLASVEQANLSDWEKNVLMAYLSGGRGWQTEVAKNNINPETGKPYSRMAPHIAMDRIREKIMGIYQKDVA
jgi:RNA polymerase sigma factor (sigma-70 family)